MKEICTATKLTFCITFPYLGAAGRTGRHCCFQGVRSRCDLKKDVKYAYFA